MNADETRKHGHRVERHTQNCGRRLKGHAWERRFDDTSGTPSFYVEARLEIRHEDE
jgi:hypothetical protein